MHTWMVELGRVSSEPHTEPATGVWNLRTGMEHSKTTNAGDFAQNLIGETWVLNIKRG